MNPTIPNVHPTTSSGIRVFHSSSDRMVNNVQVHCLQAFHVFILGDEKRFIRSRRWPPTSPSNYASWSFRTVDSPHIAPLPPLAKQCCRSLHNICSQGWNERRVCFGRKRERVQVCLMGDGEIGWLIPLSVNSQHTPRYPSDQIALLRDTIVCDLGVL